MVRIDLAVWDLVGREKENHGAINIMGQQVEPTITQ
jgi:hypothetical protein